MKLARTFAASAFLCLGSYLNAADYYVATDGSDSNAGTLLAPFATIQHAATVLSPGDTCYIRGGSYYQNTVIDGLHGTSSLPITFTNYSNETVTFDGSQALADLGASAWTLHSGNIYKTTLNTDIWQLYVDGALMMPARWPNASLDDNSVFDWDYWAWGNEAASSNGVLVDEPHDGIDLAATNLDLTGAIAVLDVGSWKSWTRRITSHTAGSNSFTYDLADLFISRNHYYYVSCKLNLLDVEKEWFFDTDTKTLYLHAPGGGTPSGDIRGKTQSYAFDVTNSSYLTLEGFDFFGTTFKFYESTNITVDNCELLYPSCSKRMLGITTTPDAAEMMQIGSHRPSSCTVKNSIFKYADSHAIEMNGQDNRIENCLFRYIDWSASEIPFLMATIYMRGSNAQFVRNTVHHTGASQVMNFYANTDSGMLPPLVEYNRFYRFGLIQDDGSAIHITNPSQPGCFIRYNWASDSPQYGARFDAPIPPTVWGDNGTMHHNVSWRCKGALMVKGEYHFVYNNFGFDSDPLNDIIVLDDSNRTDTPGGGNFGTITQNNAANSLSGDRNVLATINGTVSNNWNGLENGRELKDEVVDTAVRDFRPRPGSTLIDAGVAVSGITTGYSGTAPDIGAYEYGSESYWIPGYQPTSASTPIPSSGSVDQPLNRDLIYLIGREGSEARIYFGTDASSVQNATVDSVSYRGSLVDPKNIFSPGGLDPSTTYYWRVDTVKSDGTVVTGPLWHFTTMAYTGITNRWRFEGDANDTLGSINGSLMNSANASASDDFVEGGSSLATNGSNQWVSLGNSSSLQNTFSAKTIGLWFKTSTTSNAEPQVLFETGDQAEGGIALRLNGSSLEAAVANTGSTTTVAISGVNANQWHYAAVSYDGAADNLLLYLDGDFQRAASASPASVPSSSDTSAIAAVAGSDAFGTNASGQYFNGRIDDLRCYSNTALSYYELVAIHSLDTDGDGLMNDWELQNFSTLTAANSLTDSDIDGIPDIDEQTAGTDPNDWNSRLAGAIQPGTEEFTITWPSVAGKSYRFWMSNDLSNWSTESVHHGINGTLSEVFNPSQLNSETKQFFRITTP